MITENFNLIKLGAFVFSFAIVGLLQASFPYRPAPKLLTNWGRNISLATINTLLLGTLCTACVCSWSTFLQTHSLGLFNFLLAPAWLSIPATVLVLDLTAYAWHRANHSLPLLWRFHSVHHSDDVFEASTALRFHIGELAASLAVRIVIVGLFGLSIPGLLTFEVIYQFCNIFEHGNTKLGPRLERWWSMIFVTPAVHRKHHSLEVRDLHSNFATIFSCWDKIFGTYHDASSLEKIEVGLNGVQELSLRALLLQPFRAQSGTAD